MPLPTVIRPWPALARGVVLTLLMVAATAAHGAAVDVNTATQAQLEQLRGIGVSMSEKLLAERAKQPFADWADLIARVPGVSVRSAERLSAQGLRVGERAYEPPPR
ncbi:helix-hairpin-helix domain-containing protein [uncultured Azohydromonas sp.]|jgi:DNA uptake protein and related DNA-binding proteins|uniref:ComEA family DNA-binding protein n=1 Tax=uncultured Azohydromonas sp. TaxID=487342 RepID=UPI00262FB2C0|nr:helix-hairpin-helix domain-containing protein [uncultured Azohydromonas sp.]